MGKYQKMASAILTVCLLVCLLAGCRELHSDSYEDIMNGIVIESAYAGICDGAIGMSLTLQDNGKVQIQAMQDYVSASDYLDGDYDAEVAAVYMYSGTYKQEDGLLTVNIDTMRGRLLVRGEDKQKFRDAYVKENPFAASVFTEDGIKASMMELPETITVKIDVSGESWKWLSSDVYNKDGTLYEHNYSAENGNIISEYYDDGNLDSKTEYSPEGIKLRWTSYYEGEELSRREYYEDGTLKLAMHNGFVEGAYDRDGNEIAFYDHVYMDGACVSCGEAEPQYSEGLQFKLYGESGDRYYGYSVTGLGSCTDTDIVIPPMYNGLPVFEIEEKAFSQCRQLTSVTIPESVISILPSAFAYCTNLAEVTVHKGCNHGGEEREDGLEYIWDYVFSGCSSLTGITIPESVTNIGYGAFFDCNSLSSITVESGNTVYHSAGNCLIETESKRLILGCQNSVIPADGSVTDIGPDAFNGCSNLTGITIPDGITDICGEAFYGCSSLKSITIPNSVMNIHQEAFYGCSGLKSITIPNGVSWIGFNAFENCSSLGNITIPDSVTHIGGDVFRGCSSLKSVTIGNGVNEIASNLFRGCSSLTSITIPNSVTSIGSSAFLGCSGLKSITIPNSVTDISWGAFYDCSSLTEITYKGTKAQWNAISKESNWDYDTGGYTINYTNGGNTVSEGLTYTLNEDNKSYSVTGIGTCKDTDLVIPATYKGLPVTDIGDEAFYRVSLGSITIPDSVTRIGEIAFDGISGLKNITIGSGVMIIDWKGFGCGGNLTSITVASGNKRYHSAGNCLIETEWKELILGCKNSIIPTDGSVTTIGTLAFNGCGELESITIPDGVTDIDYMAFQSCGLKSIILPDSLTSIGQSSFAWCQNLRDITYKGTKAQWNAIDKHKGEETSWNYETGNYTVHCTDGDIAKADS